ncbi:MAG: hypothetical protein MUF25_24055, partial [Pirellulaceae bacterium]|nr:hypothetical protein [Pirellulaceae bacterium]
MPADNLDYLFLSALAVSNRHIVYGLERDEAERKRIRHWYDWARAHEDLMTRQAVFLPDWQGNGKCDSYFRLNAAGTGYAFVFNANDTPVSTELPLDERCGLVAGREYRVRPEFPDSPDTQVARRSVAVTVPARQVLLLELVSYRQPQLMNPKGQGPILTCFGRTARGGFFCGVELPFDASSQNANSVVLAYRPNLKIRAGPRLTCEPAYLGVYRKGASEQAPEGLPLRSESDAMVAMTAAILPPQQRRLGPLMCGWWSELYRGPYRTGGDVENHLGAVDFALDCGIDIISDPRTWAGELDKINVLREGEELQLGELALKVAASARHKGARWVFWPTMGNSDPWGNNTDGDPQWRNGIDLPTRLEADAGGDKSYWLTVAPETEIHWRIRSAGGSLTMQFSGNGANLGKVEGVELVFPFAPGVTPVTAISSVWDDDGSFHLPALVSAPDFGQLLLTGKSAGPDRKPIKKARLDGSRAAKTVNLVLELTVPQAGAVDALEFAPHLLAPPAGLADTALWSQARRGWFSIWQPSAQWGDQGNPFSAPAGMLGNNVISDPASCSLWFYCNALIYRAWRCLADLEKKLGRNEPEARYTQLADKLKAAYAPTLLNPATGWLAWWKSADGELHDYAAPTVNGLAIEYGLVEPVQGRAILAKLRQKMADVGFTRFDLGVLESSLGLYGWARVPKSYPVTLPLKAGENRLL